MVSINGGFPTGYGTGRTNAKQDNQRLQNEQGFDGCDNVSGSSGSGNVSGAGNVSGTSGTGSVSGTSGASGKNQGDFWDAVSAGVDGDLNVGDTFTHPAAGSCVVTSVDSTIGGMFGWRPTGR